jgi:hypothetical protein
MRKTFFNLRSPLIRWAKEVQNREGKTCYIGNGWGGRSQSIIIHKGTKNNILD